MHHYLEDDLLSSDTIASLVKDLTFAQNLYAALCNRKWYKEGEEWTSSWRYAGELVADLRSMGEDYLDFYCSGIGSDVHCDFKREGVISDDVARALEEMGWTSEKYGVEGFHGRCDC